MLIFAVLSVQRFLSYYNEQAVRLGGRHNMLPPVRAKFEDRSFFRLRNIEGGPKISKLGHVPQATPT